jgi:hypothetical protein
LGCSPASARTPGGGRWSGAEEDNTSLGLDDSEIDVLARKRPDRVHRFPACDDDLDPAIRLDALHRRAEKPVGALKVRPDGTVEVLDVSGGLP